jgi:hypothetical protein
MNAQLIAQLYGHNDQLYAQTSHTFRKRFQQRVFVRAFARSNVQLIAESFYNRFGNDLKNERSIVLYKLD